MSVFSIKDLIAFCKTKNCYSFSAKTPNDKVRIREIGLFNAETVEDNSALFVRLKSCHDGLNLNQSFISTDNMKAAIPSFVGKPILASIVQNEDSEWDFNGHDMKFYEDEDGEVKVEYIEQIIGNISETEVPVLEYDEDKDKNFVIAKGKIFKEYTKAAEIIERRKTCACSVELVVSKFSYNSKEDYLELEDFEFQGITLLGETVSPGMKGSHLTIETFDANDDKTNFKLIETLEKLNKTLSSFNKTIINTEGGNTNMKLEELMAKYNVATEDITFETEGLSDEELEAKFAEVFGEGESSTEGDDGSVDDEGGSTGNDEPSGDDEPQGSDNDDEPCSGFSLNEDGSATLTYKLSHDDIRSGLFELLYAEDNSVWYWIVDVYDDYMIYSGGSAYYKRKYSVNENNVSLDESKTQVFNEWLTQEEIDAIATMKSEYSTLKAFKENYDSNALRAEKEAVLQSEEYAAIFDTEEFKNLASQIDNYSVEDLKVKADLIFAAMAKKQFALDGEKKNNSVSLNLNKVSSGNENKPYGDLFDN